MESFYVKPFASICYLLFILVSSVAATAPRKLVMVQPQPLVLKYHNGQLLKGNLALSILWYGRFTPSQRAIVADFVRSLAPATGGESPPSVASWWRTTGSYKGGPTTLSLGPQLLDEGCSLGKSLKSSDIAALAEKAAAAAAAGRRGSISVVLTGADVAVEGFCSSRCGTHAPFGRGATYVWVGNSVTQCPGQCAWPFHQPIYGPQSPPLVAPNGDVGLDGMVINLATVLAGAVTNPDGNGYFQGEKDAPLEAVTACTGAFGKGAYPGYPGEVMVDPASGASYNARGSNGRKYLLPAMWDPKTSQCATLV